MENHQGLERSWGQLDAVCSLRGGPRAKKSVFSLKLRHPRGNPVWRGAGSPSASPLPGPTPAAGTNPASSPRHPKVSPEGETPAGTSLPQGRVAFGGT